MNKPTFYGFAGFLRLRSLGKGSVYTCECDVKLLTDQRPAAQSERRSWWP